MVAVVAGEFVGLSSGWVITVTVAVVLALFWPVNTLNNALAAKVSRRRTTWPSSLSGSVTPADLDQTAEIIMMLGVVRDRLAVVMKGWSAAHRFGHVARTAAGFDWLRRRIGTGPEDRPDDILNSAQRAQSEPRVRRTW
ncbi:hypothetical protein [Micromonospora sp. KC213]|uniref:hypothetical protein n=1 Tax=Micromonospora sp. KC213 TaxID=2530378 RepID=UPI001045845B|nr:hypothetical protein [Micromonospora sp. KC213]TDC43937.1 hypothetical protein E1166_01535 [Micromonospora sp. KC213]